MDLHRELATLGPQVVDVESHYAAGTDRVVTYKRIATVVIDAAMAAPPVALVLYGHPLILVMPSQIILRTAPLLGLRVRTFPAVSALDCLMADLGIDLVSLGFQSHEATDLLLYDRNLVPNIATVIWQVGSLGTRLHTDGAPIAQKQIGQLVEHLLRFFPRAHPVFAVCSSIDGVPPRIVRCQLDQLPRYRRDLHGGVTLYLPPIGVGPVRPEVASKLIDPEVPH